MKARTKLEVKLSKYEYLSNCGQLNISLFRSYCFTNVDKRQGAVLRKLDEGIQGSGRHYGQS